MNKGQLPPYNPLETPWPRSSTIKRKAPGLAVPGRKWLNVDARDLPALIGDVLADVLAPNDALTVELTNPRTDGPMAYADVHLVAVHNKVQEIYSFPSSALTPYIKAFISQNDGSEVPLQLHANACEFWENIPRVLVFDEDPTNV
jgi:hypothetical protein